MRRIVWTATMASLLGGCGGSGGGSDDSETVFVVDPLEHSVNSGGGVGVQQLLVADQADDSSVRALVTFDLPVFPPGTEILSATLHSSVSSSDEGLFAAMGPVVLDHVDSTLGVVASRDAVALLSAFVVLATDGTAGPRDVDVTAAVQADVAAGRTSTRLRLRHQAGDTNGDGLGDFTRFGSTVNPPRAELEITFRP
jgi:hypothetical protein